MRRCSNLYNCINTGRINPTKGILLCEIFMCWDYLPVSIDEEWKPFMENLNRSLKDWKYYFS